MGVFENCDILNRPSYQIIHDLGVGGGQVRGILYAPAHKLVDWTLLPMFLIALTAVTLGGWLSGSGIPSTAGLTAEQHSPSPRTTIGIASHEACLFREFKSHFYKVILIVCTSIVVTTLCVRSCCSFPSINLVLIYLLVDSSSGQQQLARTNSTNSDDTRIILPVDDEEKDQFTARQSLGKKSS